ncbi:MAG: hypothetical protein V3571_07960 [Pseudodesulfovibrio sp.]
MRKTLMVSRRCENCVFFRKQCVLGHRRPWNSASCDDYRPYCLICNYPLVYCNTCRNLLSRRLKPLEFDRLERDDPTHAVRFDCVWRGPRPSA